MGKFNDSFGKKMLEAKREKKLSLAEQAQEYKRKQAEKMNPKPKPKAEPKAKPSSKSK
jgi:ribosomal protein L44E